MVGIEGYDLVSRGVELRVGHDFFFSRGGVAGLERHFERQGAFCLPTGNDHVEAVEALAIVDDAFVAFARDRLDVQSRLIGAGIRGGGGRVEIAHGDVDGMGSRQKFAQVVSSLGLQVESAAAFEVEALQLFGRQTHHPIFARWANDGARDGFAVGENAHQRPLGVAQCSADDNSPFCCILSGNGVPIQVRMIHRHGNAVVCARAVMVAARGAVFVGTDDDGQKTGAEQQRHGQTRQSIMRRCPLRVLGAGCVFGARSQGQIDQFLRRDGLFDWQAFRIGAACDKASALFLESFQSQGGLFFFDDDHEVGSVHPHFHVLRRFSAVFVDNAVLSALQRLCGQLGARGQIDFLSGNEVLNDEVGMA